MAKQIRSITRHEDFKNHLRQKIMSGIYAPGDKIPSIRQMAEEYGLSKVTVNMAISNLVTEGLIFTDHGRGIFVSQRNAGTKKAEDDIIKIGLVYQDIYGLPRSGEIHPSVLPWVSELEVWSGVRHYSLNLFSYRKKHFWDDGQNRLKKEILAGSIDGLLIMGPLQASEVDALNEEGIPFVLICNVAEGRNTVSVDIDMELGCRLLLSHMKESGHEHVGLITYTCGQGCRRTVNSFMEISKEFGFITPEKNIILIENETTWPDLNAVSKFFDLNPMPTAAILYDEVITNRFIMESLIRKIEAPDELAFANLIDMQPHSHIIPITGLNFESLLKRITNKAVELLTKMIDGAHVPPQTVYVKPKLLIRESAASPVAIAGSDVSGETISSLKGESAQNKEGGF